MNAPDSMTDTYFVEHLAFRRKAFSRSGYLTLCALFVTTLARMSHPCGPINLIPTAHMTPAASAVAPILVYLAALLLMSQTT